MPEIEEKLSAKISELEQENKNKKYNINLKEKLFKSFPAYNKIKNISSIKYDHVLKKIINKQINSN